jgi:HK97 family phage prohead protease
MDTDQGDGLMAQAVHIDKHARRVMRAADPKLKAKAIEQGAADPGWIEGYAAVWNNLDRQNEVMVKGCFARSIAQAVPAGKVKLMATHFRDGGDALECIGTITQAKEDDYGLWIHADLASTDDAQNIRAKVVEGHISSLSVGYVPIRWEVRNTEMENGEVVQTIAHLETRLAEVTTTVRPANELATITAAKSENHTDTTPTNGGAATGASGVTPPNAAQNTGKASDQAPGVASGKTAPPATSPAGQPAPLDLPRIKRDLVLKRARLGLLTSEA